MAEFDSSRTYALPKLQFCICDPLGRPLSIHKTADLALGTWFKSRGGIILDEKSRQRAFTFMLREKYSIRQAYAWCRVADPIIKLSKEKKDVQPKRKAKRQRA